MSRDNVTFSEAAMKIPRDYPEGDPPTTIESSPAPNIFRSPHLFPEFPAPSHSPCPLLEPFIYPTPLTSSYSSKVKKRKVTSSPTTPNFDKQAHDALLLSPNGHLPTPPKTSTPLREPLISDPNVCRSTLIDPEILNKFESLIKKLPNAQIILDLFNSLLSQAINNTFVPQITGNTYDPQTFPSTSSETIS